MWRYSQRLLRREATIYERRPISARSVAKPQHDGSLRAPTNAPACRSDSNHIRRRGAKSFVDDLVLSRGVVLSRADLFCDLLRLSPLTRRFVRLRRTYRRMSELSMRLSPSDPSNGSVCLGGGWTARRIFFSNFFGVLRCPFYTFTLSWNVCISNGRRRRVFARPLEGVSLASLPTFRYCNMWRAEMPVPCFDLFNVKPLQRPREHRRHVASVINAQYLEKNQSIQTLSACWDARPPSVPYFIFYIHYN